MDRSDAARSRPSRRDTICSAACSAPEVHRAAQDRAPPVRRAHCCCRTRSVPRSPRSAGRTRTSCARGHDSARVRVEAVLREEALLDAFEVLHLHCDLLIVRVPLIDSSKDLPDDLRAPVATVTRGAAHDELPELHQIASQFAGKRAEDATQRRRRARGRVRRQPRGDGQARRRLRRTASTAKQRIADALCADAASPRPPREGEGEEQDSIRGREDRSAAAPIPASTVRCNAGEAARAAREAANAAKEAADCAAALGGGPPGPGEDRPRGGVREGTRGDHEHAPCRRPGTRWTRTGSRAGGWTSATSARRRGAPSRGGRRKRRGERRVDLRRPPPDGSAEKPPGRPRRRGKADYVADLTPPKNEPGRARRPQTPIRRRRITRRRRRRESAARKRRPPANDGDGGFGTPPRKVSERRTRRAEAAEGADAGGDARGVDDFDDLASRFEALKRRDDE